MQDDTNGYDRLLTRAEAAFNLQRYDLAADLCEQALVEEPNRYEAMQMLGTCCLNTDRLSEALYWSGHLIEAFPAEAYPYYLRGSVLTRRHAWEEALQAVQNALARDAAQPDFFALASALCEPLSRFEEAGHYAQAGLLLNPEHAGCLKAYMLSLMGQERPFREVAERLVQLSPTDAEAHALLGQAEWSEAGDAEAAMLHFREALRLHPDYEPARLGLLGMMRTRTVPYRLFNGLQHVGEERIGYKFLIYLSVFLTLAVYIVPLALFWQKFNPFWIFPAVLSYPVVSWLMSQGIARLLFRGGPLLGTALSNLWLLTNPFARHLLTAAERRQARVIGGVLAGMLAGIGYFFVR